MLIYVNIQCIQYKVVNSIMQDVEFIHLGFLVPLILPTYIHTIIRYKLDLENESMHPWNFKQASEETNRARS